MFQKISNARFGIPIYNFNYCTIRSIFLKTITNIMSINQFESGIRNNITKLIVFKISSIGIQLLPTKKKITPPFIHFPKRPCQQQP